MSFPKSRSRAAPVLAGLATAALTWWIWGFAADPSGVFHDENAYRLQARIFAAGRWADPAVPADSFFDQMHVLSRPLRAAKYPPGHALALAIGFAAGAPPAVTLLLAFGTGALLFALAREISDGAIAFLAWLIWLTSPGALLYRSSYFSELTTAFLWLAAWWMLWRWRNTRAPGWLVALAALVGFGAVTRPLTMVVFALPIAFVLLRSSGGGARWRALAAAALCGAAVMLLWPLWSLKTTGKAGVSPHALYTRTVMPWDRIGLGRPPSDVPLAALPEDARGEWIREFVQLHERHTVANLPGILRRRLVAIWGDMWGGWRAPLFPFALAGLFVAPAAARVGLAAAALLVLAHLVYASPAGWTVYYYECYAVFAFVTAVGLGWAWRRLVEGARAPRLRTSGLWLSGAAILIGALPAVLLARATYEANTRGARALSLAMSAAPPPAVVFVRYGPRHDPHRSLVVNGPDLANAPFWIVHDRGSDNQRLLRLAPQRAPYLYDEARQKLTPLDRTAVPADRYNPAP
jgi:hypothetical protein